MDHGNKTWKFSSWPGLTEQAVEKSFFQIYLNYKRSFESTKSKC
jgi:hypothetical protein